MQPILIAVSLAWCYRQWNCSRNIFENLFPFPNFKEVNDFWLSARKAGSHNVLSHSWQDKTIRVDEAKGTVVLQVIADDDKITLRRKAITSGIYRRVSLTNEWRTEQMKMPKHQCFEKGDMVVHLHSNSAYWIRCNATTYADKWVLLESWLDAIDQWQGRLHRRPKRMEIRTANFEYRKNS